MGNTYYLKTSLNNVARGIYEGSDPGPLASVSNGALKTQNFCIVMIFQD